MSSAPAAPPALVADWVGLDPGGSVVLRTGKVELGQGAVTAIVQMGCHELGLDPAAVRWVSGDTVHAPDEWYTAGSASVEVGGGAMRRACAQARELVLAAAAMTWNAHRDELDIVRGVLHRQGVPTGMSLATALAAVDLRVPVNGAVPLRHGAGLIGRALPRLDLAEKMRGGGFIHDTILPGMLVGRVLRPPNHHAQLVSADRVAMQQLPGVVTTVVDGRFVAYLATSESAAWSAYEAAQALCQWQVPAVHPDAAGTGALLAGLRVQTRMVRAPGPATTAAGVVTQHSATFSKPAIAHASIGPSCAVATFDQGRFEVLSHSQGVYALQFALAAALRVPRGDVHVRHVPGAGCYGHNGADDAALDACLLARAVPGRPVKLTWSRADELTASAMGSPMRVRIAAELGQARIRSWRLEVWSGSHGARPGWGGAVNLLGATHLAEPIAFPLPQDVSPEMGGGGDRNAAALYDLPQHEVLYHFLPDMPLRTSSLRALGSYANLFAIESFIDELAAHAGVDALQFRLDHLADERARDVLQRVARAAAWQGGSGASDTLHQGIGFGRYKNKAAYIAVVVQVAIEDDFRVDAVWACVDAGLVINPDCLRHQIEGGLVQSLSWTLYEQVRFSTTHIESRSWEDYPILPFAATPAVQVEIVEQPGQPPLGVGEVAQGPTAAAVANALSRGLGVRLRDLPLTRDNLIAAMA
jgi:CO/xanthine dehydrogenase Mo-binding subunit